MSQNVMQNKRYFFISFNHLKWLLVKLLLKVKRNWPFAIYTAKKQFASTQKMIIQMLLYNRYWSGVLNELNDADLVQHDDFISSCVKLRCLCEKLSSLVLVFLFPCLLDIICCKRVKHKHLVIFMVLVIQIWIIKIVWK